MRRKMTRFLLFLLTIPVLLFIFLPVIYLVITSISTRGRTARRSDLLDSRESNAKKLYRYFDTWVCNLGGLAYV